MLDQWRVERRREYVCLISVHGLVVSQRDPAIRSALNRCGMAAEDGMPLVWWSRLAGFAQARRVCGSDLMEAVCAQGVARGYRHYFYGASPRMLEHLGKIDAAALLGVGAAFDFHAGTKPRAPIWMQRSGLEWFFRLMTEPRRLAHRYLIDNALFLGYTLQHVAGWRAPRRDR